MAMSEIRLTRAQRRQMQKLADKVDRVTQGDRRFFERRPDRQHRVRLAGMAEFEQHELINGPLEIPPGFQLFAVVRNIAPGHRMRLFLPAPEGRETDVSEITARAIWDAVATPKIREVEAQMRKIAEART
jgi:hypothetical protein